MDEEAILHTLDKIEAFLDGKNEDGVPMNETDAGNLWKSWIEKEGCLCVKVENIGLSLPDYFWIHKGITIWNEAKIKRGNLIYAPVYQFHNMRKMSLYLRDWALSYVVYNAGEFELYSFKEVLKDKASWTDTTFDLTKTPGKMKIDLSNRTPFLVIPQANYIGNYIDWVDSKAFRKKS